MKPNMLSTSFYLVVGAKKRAGYSQLELTKPEARTARKGPPATRGNEIAIKVEISLPDSLFKDPTYRASLTVPADAAASPVIEAEVINNIESVVAQATGLRLKIEVDDE